MKRKFLYLPVAMLALFFAAAVLSSYSTKRAVDDFWKSLGLSQQSGTEGIKNSFLNGYLQYYGARNIKNIAVGDRKAVATDLLAYTKQYISGAAFKKQYEDMRRSAQPVKPAETKQRTIEDIQKEEVGKIEQGIKDLEKSIKEATPDVAKSLKPVLEMQKQMLKEYQNPKNEMFKIMLDGEKYQSEDNQKRYKEDLDKWQEDYPENVNLFIADKLKKMLEATKGIDYNAALVEKYNKKRFANSAYESKNSEWKRGFRAGKEVTETARAFAQQWLTELK